MAKERRQSPTKLEIIKVATELFLENGFSKTTSTEVCRKADISTGNLTFYFPTKEHILATLVNMICDFQWQIMQETTDEGNSSLLAYCLELTTIASVCEDVPQMHDLYTAAYYHPMTLDIIRANDTEKIKQVFSEYIKGWEEEKITEAEVIISGIEFATLMKTEHSASLPVRIEGALDTIMLIFGVPEDIRKMKIQKVLKMDYKAIGKRIYEDFKKYATETNENALEELMKNSKLRRKCLT